MFTAEKIGGGEPQLSEARTIGSTANGVFDGRKAHRSKGLARKFDGFHVLAEPIGHIAVLPGYLALELCTRFGNLKSSTQGLEYRTFLRQSGQVEIPQNQLEEDPIDTTLDMDGVNETFRTGGGFRSAVVPGQYRN